MTHSPPKRLGARMVPLDRLEAASPELQRDARRPPGEAPGPHQADRAVSLRHRPAAPERTRTKFQVLDGHHRLAILRELGHTEARCDVWDVNDREAKLLLATLNRLQGQDLPIKRAQLIHDLLGEMSLDDLAGLLPETDKQLEELHALLEFPAEEIAAQLEAEAEAAERVLPRVLSFVVSPEQEELITHAVEAASDGTPGRDRKARGLTNLAKHYLEEADEAVADQG